MSCDKSSRQKKASSWFRQLRHVESPRPVSGSHLSAAVAAVAGPGGGESDALQRRPDRISSAAAVELDCVHVENQQLDL